MRPRFTIRDIVLVTIMVAIAVGWWLDRSNLDRQRVKAEESSEAAKMVLNELMSTFDSIHPGWRRSKWAEMPEEYRQRMEELDKQQ
jgi:hypothetical protein